MKNSELTEIVGGAGWGFWATFGGGVIFLLGFLEGIVNPTKCGK